MWGGEDHGCRRTSERSRHELVSFHFVEVLIPANSLGRIAISDKEGLKILLQVLFPDF